MGVGYDLGHLPGVRADKKLTAEDAESAEELEHSGMNRGFLIILAPGLLVALLYLGFGWDLRVSWPAALVVLVLAGGALLVRRRRVSARP